MLVMSRTRVLDGAVSDYPEAPVDFIHFNAHLNEFGLSGTVDPCLFEPRLSKTSFIQTSLITEVSCIIMYTPINYLSSHDNYSVHEYSCKVQARCFVHKRTRWR